MGLHALIRLVGVGALVAYGAGRGASAHDRLTAWDAGWYRHIANHGYGHVRVVPDGRTLADYAFFPLYPALEHALSRVTGLAPLDAGLLISAVASLVAAWGIYAVAELLYDARTGIVLVVLWSAVPIGIVESMAYTESLFTALAAWSIYFSLRGWFVGAGVLAALAGLTRPIGGCVALAVMVAAALAVRRSRRTPTAEARSIQARALLGAAIAPLGTAGYLLWVARQRDDLLGYFTVTRDWGNGFDGGRAFLTWAGELLTGPDPLPGLALWLGLAALLAVLVHLVRARHPVVLVVFAVATVAVALTTSGYAGSKPRYLLPAFPLLLPLAVVLARTSARTRLATLVPLALVGAGYGALWVYGSGPP